MSLIVSYIVDRAALFRMHSKPPNYDDSLAKLWTSLLPYAAFVHLGISIWTYSEAGVLYSPSIFQSAALIDSFVGSGTTETVGSFVSQARDSSGLDVVGRISRENTLPLFILLGIVVVGWVLWVTIGFALMYCARTACLLLTCGRCCA